MTQSGYTDGAAAQKYIEQAHDETACPVVHMISPAGPPVSPEDCGKCSWPADDFFLVISNILSANCGVLFAARWN